MSKLSAAASGRNLPGGAVSVTTYSELQQIAQAFARGDLNLLILLGAPGLEKSRTLRDAVSPKACYIEGNATPFGVYCQLYHHRHQPIILDDVDNLYQDAAGIRLLKALCQTDPVKTVTWLSAARALEREDIPQRFRTRSPLALVANHWPRSNPHLAAVEDRGLVVCFEPSGLDVHARTGEWYWDQEIYDFLGERLHLIVQPSMRLYVLAWQLKKAGLDWRRYVLGRLLSGTALLVAQLKADPRYGSEAERVHAFIAAGGGCRATYFNHARRFVAKTAVAQRLLTGQAPTAPPEVDLWEQLRKRYGGLHNG
jgi:hypothetical protein